jgi:hypothetical protein
MNIYYLPFIASIIFLAAAVAALYSPGRIQGIFLGLVGLFASGWIFFMGLEYYLYSINSRNLYLIKTSSFLVGMFSHLFVPAVTLLAWKFPPITRMSNSVILLFTAFCCFMGSLSWWGIDMYFDGLAIQRRQHSEIMLAQGLWFAFGTGYGLIHLYRKSLFQIVSRIRESQIRTITISLGAAFIVGVIFTHFVSLFYSHKHILHMNVIVISGFITSIAYILPVGINVFTSKLHFAKYDPDTMGLVSKIKNCSETELPKLVENLRKDGFDISILTTSNALFKEDVLYLEDFDFKPDTDEYKLLSAYDAEAIVRKGKSLVLIHSGVKSTTITKGISISVDNSSFPVRNKDGFFDFQKGDFGIFKDSYFQYLIDLSSGRIMGNYYHIQWSNVYVNSGYAKIHQIFLDENKTFKSSKGIPLLSFQEYCKLHKIHLTSDYKIIRFQNKKKVQFAICLYLRDVFDLKHPIVKG